jgi:(1->4)-alpha-D-glucan 1-alpha-D-glucosylmutase
VLDGKKRKGFEKENKEQRVNFGMRLQQYTGPLMAKGHEDTTLYVYNRLLSLNEVGGVPAHFGTSMKEWHQFNRSRETQWPHTMSASATHDTKRGEDVRARINVLSEIPDEWNKKIFYWHQLNRNKKLKVKGKMVPGKNEEYFLYQTMMGTYPFQEGLDLQWTERVKNYMIKAGREGKVYTNWIDPQTTYEKALTEFVERIVGSKSFFEDFKPFQKKVAFFGMLNSLSQTLIKITSPGIPDFYQGTELWDLSLVDPDNRRSVDYETRTHRLSEMLHPTQEDRLKCLKELWSTRSDGGIKLYTIYQALQMRKTLRECFTFGTYHPIEPKGHLKEQVIAFARNQGSVWTLTIVPRFLAGLIQEGELPHGDSLWGNTTLVLPAGAPSQWADAMTGQQHRTGKHLKVCDILKYFPVSLLVGEEKK